MKSTINVAIALLFALFATLHGAEAPKPNIVFIFADDLGYGDVHCLNPERGKIPTPHLDKLASQGMSFTNAHSGSSVCTPTRYGVLTGRYAWRSQLQKGVWPDNRDPLIVDGRLTVAALLKQHGYHTACIGKWHVGFNLEGVPQGKHSMDGTFAIRKGQWKLVIGAASEAPASQKGDRNVPNVLPADELYDLSNDSGETTHLQAGHPEVVMRLTELLKEIIADGRSTPGERLANDVPIEIRKMQVAPRRGRSAEATKE